jgi:hypothetical protein
VLKLRSYDPTNPATLRYAFPTNTALAKWRPHQTEVRDPADLLALVRGAEDADPVPVSTINNIVTFRYTPGITDGRDEVVVFLGPLQAGGFSEDSYAWSSAEILLGTTLRFERTPDVADDRRLKYGTVRISRSGALTNLSLSLRAPLGYVA